MHYPTDRIVHTSVLLNKIFPSFLPVPLSYTLGQILCHLVSSTESEILNVRHVCNNKLNLLQIKVEHSMQMICKFH